MPSTVPLLTPIMSSGAAIETYILPAKYHILNQLYAIIDEDHTPSLKSETLLRPITVASEGALPPQVHHLLSFLLSKISS